MPDVSSIFQLSPIPADAMQGYYVFSLVLLSYIMATLGSYVALEIATSLRQEHSQSDVWLLFGGAFAMGAGIFTMHFIGMLAFVMPMQMNYDLWITLLSLLVAIVASGFAFILIRRPQIGKVRFIFGGTILGLAIASMHYTGMASMLDVTIHYIPSLFFLSIVIAIAASTAALWFMLQCERVRETRQWLFKISSALIMGVAICGMHYTAMAAAVFLPANVPRTEDPLIVLLSPPKLAILVAYMASLIMIVTLLFNSYRHLILVKLLMGYITIIFLTIPLGFISVGIFNTINDSFANVNDLNDLANLQERIQLFSRETLFVTFLVVASIILFAVVLSLFLSLQFSNPISQLRDSARKVAKGDLTQRVHIASDDELGQLGKSFNTMVEALAKSKKEGDEFMSLAAHDLKHPLSIIMQASSLVENEVQEKKLDKVEKLIQMIHKASASILTLINDLLLIRSFEPFVFQIERKKVNIRQFMHSLFEFNQLLANKKGIPFTMDIQVKEENYLFDEDKIAQVINNLLSNAFKFSHSGSPVKLLVKADESVLRVEVHDEAGGIPIKEQSKVFTKFAKLSVKPTDGESTHGLGLSICRDIITAHDGHIAFNSIPGKGSVFYFELKVQPV